MLLSKQERAQRIGELREIFRQITELEEQAAAIIERSVCGTFVEVGMHIDGKKEPEEDDEPAGGGNLKERSERSRAAARKARATRPSVPTA